MDIAKPVRWSINVGLILATLGVLGAVTAELKNEVVDLQRHGMVSLLDFNRRPIRRR